MRAVFKHELSTYFTGISGYVFGAFILLFAGIYTMVYNLQYAVTNFEYVLGGISFVFLVAVPILTMRVLAEEKTLLEDYLGNGGNVVLITDPPQEGNLPNLEKMMAYYGIYAEEGIVVEGSQSNYAFGTPYYLLPDMNSHTITTPLMDAGYYVLLPIAQGLSVDSSIRETLTVTSLLTTSDAAFSKPAGYRLTTYEKEEGDINGPFTLAAAAMEAVDDDIYANVIWVSSASLLDEQTNTQVSGGNLDFFLNILNYYCESDGSGIAIHAKSLDTEYLTMDSGTSAALTVVFLGLIPVGYLAVGIVIWFRRKRR